MGRLWIRGKECADPTVHIAPSISDIAPNDEDTNHHKCAEKISIISYCSTSTISPIPQSRLATLAAMPGVVRGSTFSIGEPGKWPRGKAGSRGRLRW